MQKRCGLRVKATESLFAVNAPVLKPLDRTAIRLKKKKNLFSLKHYGAGLNSPPLLRPGVERWKLVAG